MYHFMNALKSRRLTSHGLSPYHRWQGGFFKAVYPVIFAKRSRIPLDLLTAVSDCGRIWVAGRAGVGLARAAAEP